MSGSVDVQSRARRSYRAVVIPTDALLTFGMLKLTSLIVTVIDQLHRGQGTLSADLDIDYDKDFRGSRSMRLTR